MNIKNDDFFFSLSRHLTTIKKNINIIFCLKKYHSHINYSHDQLSKFISDFNFDSHSRYYIGVGKILDPTRSNLKNFEFGSDGIVNKTRSDKIFETWSGCDRVESKPIRFENPIELLKKIKIKPKWLNRTNTNTMAHTNTLRVPSKHHNSTLEKRR